MSARFECRPGRRQIERNLLILETLKIVIGDDVYLSSYYRCMYVE